MILTLMRNKTTKRLNEETIRIYSMLLERFGPPLTEALNEDQAADSAPFGCDEADEELLRDDSEGVDEASSRGEGAGGSMSHDVDSEFADDEAAFGLEEDDFHLEEEDLDQDSMALGRGSDAHFRTTSEDDDLDEVAPPDDEKIVKALKKQKGVKNPWAVAWKMHDRQ